MPKEVKTSKEFGYFENLTKPLTPVCLIKG
nr:MAG TPA: hypothetical protein [Caudoviricetes sp.]